ncbi:MAG TPA: FtsX-like permease family protein, partial [Blastocatellia bacterium]|nr:FtsX-like permease family protein [Blastocatellia bacterium]
KAALGEALKSSGRGLIGSSRYRLHRFVVSAQVALTLVLLVGAGLLIRSFANLLDADTGFDAQNLLTVRIAPPLAPPRPDQTMETYIEHYFAEREKTAVFYRDLISRIDSLPGVRATGAINRLPMRGSWWQLDLEIEGSPTPDPDDKLVAFGRVVTPGYFAAMRIPLLNGRFFEEADGPSTRRVAVINSAMSQRYFSGTDPLGRRIRLTGEPDEWGSATIIGVVGDVRHAGLASEAEPMIYVPLSQAAFGFFGDWGMTMVIRTEINPMSLVAAVRREALSLDAALPIYEIAAMDQVIGETIAERRFNMLVLASFAILALALAAAGLYGVMSYQTNNRTREIGIRMALGAERSDILKMVLKEGIAVAAAGVTAGLVGAFALTRAMTSLLYGVSATNPAIFFGLAIMLLAVAAVACYIPARRATKIDPMIALRCE